jgi:geranylgeranyl pyrophosphate synthase
MTAAGNFREYLAARRPRLDEALAASLAQLLKSVSRRDAASLLGALAAGKKVRGGLSCLISDALGGPPEAAIPRAVAVEMIQVATLIHDDFIDQDEQRRGSPAIWTLEGARRAVLIGDVIFASAIRGMSELSAADGLAVSRSIAEVALGALHEPLDPADFAAELAAGRIGAGFYERIIHLKTGVLFGAACRLGAYAAGAGAPLAERACRYGMQIGEAYQIADDLQEVRRHLAGRSIEPGRMMALAPALLHFMGEAEAAPPVLASLRGASRDFAAAAALFAAAAKRMEEEIARRLRLAAVETERHFPARGYGLLLRSTPGDIIGMFDEA